MSDVRYPLTTTECNELLDRLRRYKITKVWRGAKPAIFLELGRLSTERRPRPARGKLPPSVNGQATIMIESNWRVESARSIVVGSNFSERAIERRIPTLQGIQIAGVGLTGQIPELTISLADDRSLTTFTDWRAQPKWHVFLRDLQSFKYDAFWRGIVEYFVVTVRAGRPVVHFYFDGSNPQTRRALRRQGIVPAAEA